MSGVRYAVMGLFPFRLAKCRRAGCCDNNLFAPCRADVVMKVLGASETPSSFRAGAAATAIDHSTKPSRCPRDSDAWNSLGALWLICRRCVNRSTLRCSLSRRRHRRAETSPSVLRWPCWSCISPGEKGLRSLRPDRLAHSHFVLSE
jgi:hypothetical protein